MEVTDQLHRTLKINKYPKRIISLVPSLTELLCDLGLRDQLVGITKFCVHPSDLRKSKTMIGGTKQINLMAITELKPDLIVANKEENTPEIIEQLKNVVPIHISDINNLDDCFHIISSYGKIFDKREEAALLEQTLKAKLLGFQDFIKDKPIINVAYFIWKNPWMVVASETFINYMLKLNNFRNVFEEQSRYPEIDLNDLRDKNLEVILLSSEPYPFKNEHIKELKLMFPNTKVKIVDGELFSWYGSRLLQSFPYFKDFRESLK